MNLSVIVSGVRFDAYHIDNRLPLFFETALHFCTSMYKRQMQQTMCALAFFQYKECCSEL